MPGFTEHLDSGAQVCFHHQQLHREVEPQHHADLRISPREELGDNEQPFGPSSIPGGSAGTGAINMFGSKYFPGVSVYNVLGDNQPSGIS